MSNEELEVYVGLVAKLMQLSPEQRELISGELQDHLQLRVEDLMNEGASKSDAISQAVKEFGDAAVMAKNFQTVHNLKRRRWTMRFMTFSIAGSFLVAVLTMAMWPQDARFGSPSRSVAQEKDTPEAAAPEPKATAEPKSTASTSTQLNEKAEQNLKQIVNLDFEGTMFVDVEAYLEKQTGLNFILTTSATDDSLPDDEPISFKIQGMPLEKALDLMLMPKNASYVIDSGVILIISLDEADDERWHRIKMFDCRELVNVLPKTSPPIRPLASRGNFSGIGVGGFGGGQKPKGEKKTATEKQPSTESKLLDAKLEKLLALMKQEATRRQPGPSAEHTLKILIESMVNSETWDDSGSGTAQLDVINGIVIARNSEGGLKRIENLIADLEDKMLDK